MLNINFSLKKHRLRTSILLAIAFPAAVWAGATLDGSMGTTGSFSGTGTDFTITESVGKREGTSLFHSFSDFSVNAGESATFTATSSISNVVSRVTGSDSTTINGGLTSTITGANFYFINPNGILFKEGASISIDGSFYASTADYLTLEDGIQFRADMVPNGALTTSSPASFGFLDSNDGDITLQGTHLYNSGGFLPAISGGYLKDTLLIPDGETFGLIGRNIIIKETSSPGSTHLTNYFGPGSEPFTTGSYIGLSGNRFEMVSVASAGDVIKLDGGGYDLSSFSQLGDITISGGSIIDSSDIYIRGGNVIIDDSLIQPGYSIYLFDPAYVSQVDGGTIDIDAEETFSIVNKVGLSNTFFANIYFPSADGSTLLPGISTFGGLTAAQDPVSININANTINISGETKIESILLGSGTSGGITLTGNNITLNNSAEIKSIVNGSGTAGDITISGNLSLYNSSAIRTTLNGTGSGSNIVIKGGNVLLTGDARIRGYRSDSGTAGNITIGDENNLDYVVEILDGSLISNINTYAGAGGNITINAEHIILDGQESNSPTGTGINTSSLFNSMLAVGGDYDFDYTYADAGSIALKTSADLTVKNGAYINTESLSFGTAGDITISANDLNLSRDGNTVGAIGSQSLFVGDSGDINIIATRDIDITGGFTISATTAGTGQGGNVDISAGNTISISGEGSGILSASSILPIDRKNEFAEDFFGYPSLLLTMGTENIYQALWLLNNYGYINLNYPNASESLSSAPSAGDAGSITISAENLNMNNDSRVTTTTTTDGNAGLLNITVDKLAMKNNSEIRSRSGLYVDGELKVGSGDGGDISIVTSKSVDMNSGSSISASSLGDGFAGTISLNSNSLDLSGSSITSQAEGAGDGGDISLIISGDVNLTDTSSISASSLGDGFAGTISLYSNSLNLSDSSITSQAESTGDGGDISIIASKSVDMESGSSISSSSLGEGLAGNIYLNAGDELKLEDSSITTQATIADGGNITIRAKDMIYLNQSDITTSVENGLGSGGNIDIDPEFFILRGSNILANAYGGDGGNIVLVAKHFITSADSSIDASSALGMDGSIDLSSPDEEVADDLVVLSDNYLDVTSLISERCGASSGSSSLVDAGSTGMSVDPDGYLPSYAIAEAYVNNNRTANKTNSMKNFMAFANIDKSQLSIAQLSCNAI